MKVMQSPQLRNYAFLMLVPGSLLLTAFLVYAPYLSSALVFDDKPYFSGPFVAHCASEIQLFKPRFLSCASFAHQYFLQGPSFEPLRIGNLLLHAGAAWVLYLFVVELLCLATMIPQHRIRIGAMATALLFVVHPMHVYAVGYLVERSIVMATLGTLLAWWAWLKLINSGSRRWIITLVLAYYFAVFSKEHAIFALAGPIALSILLRRQFPRPDRQAVLAYLLCVALGILVIYNARSMLGTLYEPMGQEVLQKASGPDIYLRSVLTQCRLFFKYISLWLIPNPIAMSVDMREPLLANVWAVKGLGYGIAYSLFGLIAFLLLIRKGYAGLLGFALLMPWTLFMTELASVRAQEIFVLYRAYIWFPSLTIPAALALASLGSVQKWLGLALAVCVVAVICLTNMTQHRLNTFVSSHALWNDAVRLIEQQEPTPMFSERAYNNRGNAMVEAGYPALGLPDIDYAIKLNDSLCAFHRTRAVALSRLKRFDEAFVGFSRTLDICPRDASAYFGRFQVGEALGRRTAALMDLRRACELDMQIACFVESRLKDGVGTGSVFRFNIGSN